MVNVSYDVFDALAESESFLNYALEFSSSRVSSYDHSDDKKVVFPDIFSDVVSKTLVFDVVSKTLVFDDATYISFDSTNFGKGFNNSRKKIDVYHIRMKKGDNHSSSSRRTAAARRKKNRAKFLHKSTDVHDMINLVSLRCYKLPSTYVLRLNNVPKLTEFSSSDQWNNTVAEILPRIRSCILDQLLHLKLSTIPSFIRATERTYMLPKLINLKNLELEVRMDATTGTYQLLSVIEACPFLEKLEMKFLWWPFDTKFREDHEWFFPRKPPNNHLKQVTLSGYLGCPSELQFALYIMKKAVALEELIVEPCDITRKIRRRATARAWQHFRPTTPNSVNLVII
ncbi:hypothetical protein Pfo_021838 [Paulownia fortunei]|nr:hypothetical protein Pfo_021838 [Paulownia fortunei]